MRGFIAFLSVICLLFSVEAAVADKRVAFVVGNGAYANVTRLSNSPMAAKAMTEVLRNVGFDVVEGTDLTRDEMAKRLLEFGNKAQGADIAVFFYSGYGIAIAGTNYLLPSPVVATGQVGQRQVSDDAESEWPTRHRQSVAAFGRLAFAV